MVFKGRLAYLNSSVKERKKEGGERRTTVDMQQPSPAISQLNNKWRILTNYLTDNTLYRHTLDGLYRSLVSASSPDVFDHSVWYRAT